MQGYQITCKYEEMMLKVILQIGFLTISISTQMQEYQITCKHEEMIMFMLEVILQILFFHYLYSHKCKYTQ